RRMAASIWARSAALPHDAPGTISAGTKSSSMKSSAWKPSGESRWRTYRPSSGRTTRATTSSAPEPVPVRRRSHARRRGYMLKVWRRLPKGLRYKAAIAWYDFLTRLDRRGEVVFLNHGFAPDGGDRSDIDLQPEDEAERL